MATAVVVNTPTRWSATERRSRTEIMKAFEAKSKNQWLIGDLLINIQQGDKYDDTEFNQKLDAIARENKVSVKTIRTYRLIAESYPATSERPSFTVARDLVQAVNAVNKTGADLDAPTEYQKMKDAGEKITVDSIASKFGREIPSRPTTDTVDNIIRSVNKMVGKLEGKKLNASAKTQLRALRLTIDVLLDS